MPPLFIPFLVGSQISTTLITTCVWERNASWFFFFFCQGMIQSFVVSVAGKLALLYWTENENILPTHSPFAPSGLESFYARGHSLPLSRSPVQPSSAWWYWPIVLGDGCHIPAIYHHQDRMTDGGAPHRQIVSPGVGQPLPSCFLHWCLMLLTDDCLFPTLPCALNILLMCVLSEWHGTCPLQFLPHLKGSQKAPDTQPQSSSHVHWLPHYNWFTTVGVHRSVARLSSSKC